MGKAIYLPSNGQGLQYYNKFNDVEVNGEGFMDTVSNVGNFVKDNKDTISAVADTAGKIASTITGIVKGAEEVENIKAMRKAARAKKGEAIYLPEAKGDGLSKADLQTPSVSNSKISKSLVDKIKNGGGFKIINPD